MLRQSLRFPVAAVRHSPGVTALSRDPYFLSLRIVRTLTNLWRWTVRRPINQRVSIALRP